MLGFASCTKVMEDRVNKLEDSVEVIQKQITELTEKLNSEVTKVKFTLRPENCSPVSDFNFGKSGNGQAKSLRRFTE